MIYRLTGSVYHCAWAKFAVVTATVLGGFKSHELCAIVGARAVVQGVSWGK